VDEVVERDLVVGHTEPDGSVVFIRVTVGDELIGEPSVPFDAGTLEDDFFIPIEPEPGQAVLNYPGVFVGGAFSVGILDSQQESAADLSSEEPVKKRRSRSTHM